MKKLHSTHHTEAILIKNLIKGDSQAFEHVVAEYHNIMLSVARAIAGDSIADEIVQDAWLSAINALPKFEGRSSLKTWLLQIVSNGAKSRVRRESRFSSLTDQEDELIAGSFDHRGHRTGASITWHEDTPEALLANEQLKTVIENCFQQLPAMQRATLSMIDIEGMTLADVCNILDISSSNARVLLHRARLAIYQSIDNYQDN